MSHNVFFLGGGDLFIYLDLQILCIHNLVSRSVLYGFCVKIGVSLWSVCVSCAFYSILVFYLLVCFVLFWLVCFILPIVITCLICNERTKGGEIGRI